MGKCGCDSPTCAERFWDACGANRLNNRDDVKAATGAFVNTAQYKNWCVEALQQRMLPRRAPVPAAHPPPHARNAPCRGGHLHPSTALIPCATGSAATSYVALSLDDQGHVKGVCPLSPADLATALVSGGEVAARAVWLELACWFAFFARSLSCRLCRRLSPAAITASESFIAHPLATQGHKTTKHMFEELDARRLDKAFANAIPVPVRAISRGALSLLWRRGALRRVHAAAARNGRGG